MIKKSLGVTQAILSVWFCESNPPLPSERGSEGSGIMQPVKSNYRKKLKDGAKYKVIDGTNAGS